MKNVASSEKRENIAIQFSLEKNTDTMRKSGIEVLGNISWGTHLCQFYETKEDLIDILVPYFAEGLRNNEFCMWVTSPPLDMREARTALQKAVPDLEQYIKKGQIEILPYTDWYLLGGEFDADRVLEGWVEKEKDAFHRGFAGLRLTGNTFWIERNCWKRFVDYEAAVNDVIGEHRIIAICTYSLEKCSGSDVIDVMRNHESILIRKGKTWFPVEGVLKRKRVEEALGKSEQQLGNIFESTTDCIITFDRSGRIIDANSKAVEVFGGSRQQLLGKHFTKSSVVSFRDTPRLLKAFANIIAGRKGKEAIFDLRIKNKKGQERFLECSGFPIKRGSNVLGLMVIARDATERKRIEEALRDSEEKYRNLFENARDLIITTDLEGNITSANRMVEEYGYDQSSIIGKNWFDLAPKEYLQQFRDGFSKLAQGKQNEGEFKIFSKQKQGYATVEYRSNPIIQDNEVVGIHVIVRDITERKKAAEALRISEERYRDLTESISDVFFAMDKNLRYTYWNKASEKLTGISAEEAIGKSLTEVFPDVKGTKVEQLYKETLRTQQPQSFENRYQINGKNFVFEINAYPAEDGLSVFVKDITEPKRAEEKLIRLSSAVKMSTDSIVISDLDGKIIDVNEATLKMYGADDKRDLVGKISFDLIAPEEREEALIGMKEVLEKGYVVGREYHIITKDGSRIPVEMSVAIMKDVDGKPIGFVGVSRDITERKKAEEALRGSENKYRTLVENLPQKIFFKDRNSVYISSNENYARDLKIKSDEIAGKTDCDYYPKKLAEKYRADDKRIMESGKIEDIEEDYIQDGQKVFVHTVKTPVKDKNGNVVGILGIFWDITEKKKMEEKLRQYSEHLEELVQKRTTELLESEKRYSVLVEEASDGVAIIQDEKIIFANKKGAEILGYSKDELIGLPFAKVVSEEYRQLTKERYERRLRGEMILSTYEIGLISKTGEHVPVELSATRIYHQGRSADLLIVRDIRERKRMEEQRLKLEKLATIGELATMVAHDLRNPLTSIRNASYYIKNSCPYRTTPECKNTVEMLDIIEQETIFANNIINDLLDFATKRPLQKKKQNINKIIEDSLTKNTIPENIKIKTNFDKKAIATVDEKQLDRVFLNLTKNTVQAMPNGGKLTITTNETKDHVEIAFTDTGAGIPVENMSKIFQPLFTTKAKGIGMGLPICKRIVEEHGGAIDVRSKVGQGTTVTIKLPKNGGDK